MLSAALVFAMITNEQSVAQQWKPVEGNIMTRWAKDVRADSPHPEYPRPTLVREKWMSLNGLWEYAIAPRDTAAMTKAEGKILVPFPIESALSGVKKPLKPDQRLWYSRRFVVPKGWGEHVTLHFDAVDWQTTVWVNGAMLGTHEGGYDRFSFDLTGHLRDGANEVTVAVWDPTDTGTQPRGKQVLNPEGIWYTAVSGIWQSVWIEPVGEAYLRRVDVATDIFSGKVKVTLDVAGGKETDQVRGRIVGPDGVPINMNSPGTRPFEFALDHPMLWSPSRPDLYRMDLTLLRDGKEADSVQTYFAFRKIELKDDQYGRRIYLNGEPLFEVGPLDQGWWPDGLYTAPTDEALKSDIVYLKSVGFNMIRKHVKVEPDSWYAWCDKLGMLVWQDMPSGDKYIGGDDPDITRTPASAADYETELTRMVQQHSMHPSIVMWVPYNEGWGQWDTARIVAMIKRLDPTRLVDNSSGWTDRGAGDVIDIHRYPGPAVPPPDGKRAQVLGEFGGLGLPIEGHLWWDKRNWGYRTFANLEELRSGYDRLFLQLDALREGGLSAAVYTQTSDCEGEVNGLLTYDRAVQKMDPKRARPLIERLTGPVPRSVVLVPTSEKTPQTWRFTTQKPSDAWTTEGFDDSSWSSGTGGFGQKSTPAPHVGTEWTSPDIWIRRTFELGSAPSDAMLRLWHDEDAEVYINGVKGASFTQWVDAYINVPLAAGSLRAGHNTIAVHCRQTSGGQFIDVGLVRLVRG